MSNRPAVLAAVAATISAACVVAMAGTAFAVEAHRPAQPVVSAPTWTPAAPTHAVATTPAIAPAG